MYNINNENDWILEQKLKKYIDDYFYPARVISILADTYLIGGAIRDLILNKKPKDLDFVVLGNNNMNWILQVLEKFNITYRYNKFGGLKIDYKGTIIDLWTTDDLFSAIQYNVDGLFFNLKSNRFISFTFNDFCENGLKLVNEENNLSNNREVKLLKFDREYHSRYLQSK